MGLCCNINIQSIKYLSSAIKKNKKITHLGLSYDINSESMKYLCEALKENKIITHLYLYCYINETSMKYLSEAISCNNSITHFYSACKHMIKHELMESINKSLDKNKIMSKQTDITLTKQNFITNEELRHVDSINLNYNMININNVVYKINDIGMKYLSNALKNNQTITEINLMYNKIDIDGMKYFCDALKASKNISKLTLRNNEFNKNDEKHLIGNFDEIQSTFEQLYICELDNKLTDKRIDLKKKK